MRNEITIDFGGFYGSIHEQLIDSAVELICTNEDDDFNQDAYDNFDFKKAFNEYSIEYLSKLSDFIGDDFTKDAPVLKFISLDSPKFYNFSTDKIIAEISEEHEQMINESLKDNDDFVEYVKGRTTPGPGYMSFFTFKEAMSNKEGMLIGYAMEFLCNEYNKEELFCGINEVNVFETIM